MKYYYRHLSKSLDGAASRSKIRLLFGARQTGKSTLLRHLLENRSPEPIVIDLQDSSRRLEYEKRPRAFSEMLLAQSRNRRTVLVDEIQKVPALLDEIQDLFDRDPRRFEFLLTGSSARRLRTHSSNLLPGRSHLFHLFPVIQWEREGKDSPRSRSKLFPHRSLEDLLILGSLPGISLEKPSSAAKSLEGYAEIYLEEEIRREGLVRDTGGFARFLELAALESGQTMNLTKLSNESGVPLATLHLFYQVLVDTFVGYWLEPFAKKARKRLLTTPKFYFFDLGVRNATARLPFNRDLIKLQGGPLLEHWIGLELIHRSRYMGRGHRVSFWRTVGGAEVDFIWETPKEIVPIEVKWTDKPTPSDARHLELFLKDHAPRAKRGLVACRVREKRQLTDRVTAVPWNEVG